jgi:transposase
VPSTGERVRRGSIIKAGNPRARRVLIEGAWTYRYPARLSRPLQIRQEGASNVVQAKSPSEPAFSAWRDASVIRYV